MPALTCRALDERHKLWEHADTEEETQVCVPIILYIKCMMVTLINSFHW